MSAHAVLSVLKEGEILKEVTLEENRDIVLGRADGCVIRLPDRAVSREHAVFRLLQEGGVQIEKKSDFGPIQVNGAECTRGLLKNGDVVAIGPYLMKVSIEKNEKSRKKNEDNAKAEAAAAALPNSAGVSVAPKGKASAGNVEPLENATSILPNDAPKLQGLGDFEMESIQTRQFDDPDNEAEARDADGALDIDHNGTPDSPADDDEQSDEQDHRPEITSFNEADGDAKTKILDSAPLSALLKFKNGDANVEEFALDAENLEIGIGRGKDCEVVLNDKKCSRKNSIIRRQGLLFEIEDLGSVNGTWVNGKKVQKQELSSGDRIRIGDIEFVFQAKDKDYDQKAAQIVELPPIEDEIPDLALSQEMPALPVGMSGANAAGAMNNVIPMPTAGQVGAVAFAPNPGAPGFADPNAAGQLGSASFNMDAVAGMGDVGKKKSLVEKFKAQPKPRQILILLAIGGLLLFLMEEEEPKKKVNAKPSPAASAKADKVIATFESLTPEQQRYVELQYQLAFDHLRNREFDKALYEVQKIFVLIPDYKEARSIERYAKEGKRKLEAIEDEKRKKEDEARLKAKIEQLSQEIEANIKKRDFDSARILFSDLLAIDPENPNIERWRAEMDRYEQETVIASERKRLQKQINEQGRAALAEADALAAQKRYYPAIDAYQAVFEIQVSEKSIHQSAKTGIEAVERAIQEERDPLLVEARQLEQSNEESKAFKLYEKATQVDPKHPEGYAGMERIRGLLHERAKAIYTEAVLAESYSDLATAKRKFQEVMDVVPSDDIYYDRAKRKLVPYVRNAVPDEAP